MNGIMQNVISNTMSTLYKGIRHYYNSERRAYKFDSCSHEATVEKDDS